MVPDVVTPTGRPGQRRPHSWPSAVCTSFRDALQPAAREDLAWAAAGVLAVIAVLWAVQAAILVRTASAPDWTCGIWFGAREEMALWVFSVWLAVAPWVLLPRFALGDVSDPDEDPVIRHGMATGRVLAFYLPALVFAVAALGLGEPLRSLASPLRTGAAMTLSAAAVAVAVNECHLWDFARRFLLRASGAVLLLLACFGRRYFGGESLLAPSSLVGAPATGVGAPGAIIGGGLPFDAAFTLFILLTCARVIATLRSPAGASMSPPGGVPDAAAGADALPSGAGETHMFLPDGGEESPFPHVPLGLDPGLGFGAALSDAYRGRARVLLLATIPALVAMVACAPVAQWLQRIRGGSLLTSLAGYPPTAWNPLSGGWEWQWSQSSSFALLAAVAAWVVLAGRLVVAPLAARAIAVLRAEGDVDGGVLSGLSPFEALAWAVAPPVLPVAALGLVAAVLAALPAYRDGAPPEILVLVVLAGPAQAAFCGLVGVVVGLRAHTAERAVTAARVVAGLGLPVALLVVRWALSLPVRGLDAPDRFIWSIGVAYQAALALSLVGGAEVAWWLLRRLRTTRAPEGGGAAHIAWRVSAASLLALAWLSCSTGRQAGHVNGAEQAFAAGDYRLAARVLRQTEPRELPRHREQPALNSWGTPSRPNPRASSDTFSPYEGAFPTSADCVRPILAAAEYSADRPDRARKVMDAPTIRAAGLAWPQDPGSMPRVQVYRYLLDLCGSARSRGSQLSTLHALIAREAARAAPRSVVDRLRYARALQKSASSPVLPPASTVFEEVVKLDPRNKEALLACGHVVEASRFYPEDTSILRQRLAIEKSPSEREKVLLAIVRLAPATALSEAKMLVKEAIAVGDLPKALRYLEAVGRSPQFGSRSYYLTRRGWVLAEMGRVPDALASYAEAKAMANKDGESRRLLPNCLGLAYLQAHDLRRAREVFGRWVRTDSATGVSFENRLEGSSMSISSSNVWLLETLFAAWCSHKIAPGGKPRYGLEEDGEIWMGNSGWEDDFTRQARRVLNDYPDCLPAAVLLAHALHDHHVGEAGTANRIHGALAPFAARYPSIAKLQKQWLDFHRTAEQTQRVTNPPSARAGSRTGPAR